MVSDRFHSDIADAVLYAFRESLHWLHKEPEKKPELGTSEHDALVNRKLFGRIQGGRYRAACGHADMLMAMLLIAAPISPEVEFAGGIGWPSVEAPSNDVPAAPALMARVGADFFEHFAVSATLLGIAGRETSTSLSFCAGGPITPRCSTGNGSFKAISGLAMLRLHTAGELQLFGEGGIGPGHLISVSADDLFENPGQHGRGGLAYLFGGGARWFAAQHVTVGFELAWTWWTNVSRPAYVYGADNIPARSDLRVSALMLLLSVGWSGGR